MHRVVRSLIWVGVVLLAVILLAGIIYALLPKGPRDPMAWNDPWQQDRDTLVAQEYAVVAGSPQATAAGLSVLEQGGTAADAAVAALLVVNVTNNQAASFPGIAPLMFYDAHTGQVRSYIGAGKAPQAATIQRFRDAGFDEVHLPDYHIWLQLVPASPDVVISLLTDYGTMNFGELAQPAIDLAREGFPINHTTADDLSFSLLERIGFMFILPTNAEIYTKNEWWRPIHQGDRMTMEGVASVLEGMTQAEQQALNEGASRVEALQAARDYFYRGPVAQAIAEFHAAEGGLMTYEDLATYSGGWEEPISAQYEEYTIYGNGPWSQGMMVPIILNILEGIDLKEMGHNSPEYVHTVNQAIELAMADRDAYIGDPAFVNVPIDVLLSDEYAASRRAQMTDSAFVTLPPPGEIDGFQYQAPLGADPQSLAAVPAALQGAGWSVMNGQSVGDDTTQVAVVDAQGNAVVITPSDFPESPMVPALGINLGTRMEQFWLDPNHPSALEPGKRPRITPHALIVFKNGEFYMAFNTPGGDGQAQTLTQVFLNQVVFGMDIQDAVEAPRFESLGVVSTFSPHDSRPGVLAVEQEIAEQAGESLESMGYTLERYGHWDRGVGAAGAIMRAEDGTLHAASDPREDSVSAGH